MTEKPQPPLPSPDVVRDLVKVGVEQIRVRKQELDLEEKESQRQYEFATKALGVQAEDRRDARKFRRKRDLDRYVFVAALFLLGGAVILALSFMGKDDLAKEISKLAAFFLAGGISGYGAGRLRARREGEPESDDDSPEANA
jgi:VIT1/CCC1 family predicted Fe2+/Mn2+ transporter